MECYKLVLCPTEESSSAFRTQTEIDLRIFLKDVASLRMAVERGSVYTVNRILNDVEAFIPWALSANEESRATVLNAIDWLQLARAYEVIHGQGAMRNPNHPLNRKIDTGMQATRSSVTKLFNNHEQIS